MLTTDRLVKVLKLKLFTGEKGLNKTIKNLNQKLSESNSTKRHLEGEVERNNRIEKDLRSRLKKLSTVLQVRLNDETNWNEVIAAIDQFVLAKSLQSSTVSPPAVKVFGLRKSQQKTATLDDNDLDNLSSTLNDVIIINCFHCCCCCCYHRRRRHRFQNCCSRKNSL